MQNKKTVALVMVVKNEEKGLEKAILSAKPFVDEIVIAVDNSSNDKTLDIARKYATTLKTFDWGDNFAEARNFAHQGVKSEWILFLDGHEYVSSYADLEKYLNLDVEGLLVRIKMETGAEFNNPRFYKNGIQFEGQVHERQIMRKTAFCSEFLIQHNRLGGQAKESAEIREKQRDDQIPRIMGAQIKANPADIRASFHLVLYYLSKNNLPKALKYQKLYLKHSKLSGERYFILFSRALSLLALGKRFRAFWVACKAENEEPQRWETEKLKGLIFFESGQYEKALKHFVDSFNKNEKKFSYTPWARDDAGTWNLIGECFYRRGVYSKASTAFYMASESVKDKDLKKFFQQRKELMQEMSKQ
jgi:glycosyltransferase involved in cell wall biosynthesis